MPLTKDLNRTRVSKLFHSRAA